MKRFGIGTLVVGGLALLLGLLWLGGAYDTRGLIFVGSPEVYTRERLVNDRYDQDFWLHSQLKRLDQSTALLTSVVRGKTSVGVTVDMGGGEAGGASGGSSEGGGDVTVEMPFDQEFLIRASVRDAIRQLILENLLDDRHDLTGNSVYGLKFDVTVIAGKRTYASAFVKASIKARQLFSEEGPGSGTGGGRGPAQSGDEEQSEAPRHVRQYFAGTITNIEEQERNPLHTSYTLYNLWIADVGARLNTYVGQIYDTIDTPGDGPSIGSCGIGARFEWERRVLQAVDDVLGISSSSFGPSSQGQGLIAITLPVPWRNHIRVLVSDFREGDCRTIPVFSTEPIWDPIYLVDGDPPGEGFIFVDTVDETTKAYASTKGYSEEELNRDPGIYQQLLPRYRRIAALADYVKNQTSGGALIPNVLPGSSRSAPIIVVPSGFFNFIESVIRTDSYTYALFPKTEVFGVLAEQSSDINAALSAAAGDSGKGTGTFSALNSERGFQAAPRTVGFSEATADGAVQFGWVVSGQGRMQSTQKSGLALVSVPAWTNELSVHVDTGWVQGSGALAVTDSYDFTVPIPPDYEAFDAFVGGSRIRHEPRISNDLMPRWDVLEACHDVSIIIPGFRLWRSTVVTLGSQTASRITVLPNMRGIIARFENLFAGSVPRTSETAKLRVWTSEGVDTAATTFNVSPPAPGTADCGSGNDDAGEVATAARTADR